MRINILAAVLLITPWTATSDVLAQAADAAKNGRTISVTGVGSVKYRPEGVKVSFGVRASDNAFATAWKDNRTQETKLREALEGLKIAGLKVKVGPPDIYQNDSIINPGLAPVQVPGGGNDKAFNVMRSFQVVVSDGDFAQLNQKMLKVIETAMTHGANTSATPSRGLDRFLPGGFGNGGSITRVEFFGSDDGNVRQQAIQKAVQAALINARGAAQGAEVKLGTIQTIVEQEDTSAAANRVLFGLDADMPAPATAQQDVNGEIELTVRVRVTLKF